MKAKGYCFPSEAKRHKQEMDAQAAKLQQQKKVEERFEERKQVSQNNSMVSAQ